MLLSFQLFLAYLFILKILKMAKANTRISITIGDCTKVLRYLAYNVFSTEGQTIVGILVTVFPLDDSKSVYQHGPCSLGSQGLTP